jgi:membrane protein YdbS with pleckstrin-like domain
MNDSTPPSPQANHSYNLGLTPIEAAQKSVMRLSIFMALIPLFIALIVADKVLTNSAILPHGTVSVPLMILGVLALISLPHRKWRRWGYDIQPDRLRIVRGFLFHIDTIVPFSRIQHIDVSRGPFERFFGVATLVVHTAGTHNATVSLPGLKPEKAEQMRETIRAKITHDID